MHRSLHRQLQRLHVFTAENSWLPRNCGANHWTWKSTTHTRTATTVHRVSQTFGGKVPPPTLQFARYTRWRNKVPMQSFLSTTTFHKIFDTDSAIKVPRTAYSQRTTLPRLTAVLHSQHYTTSRQDSLDHRDDIEWTHSRRRSSSSC